MPIVFGTTILTASYDKSTYTISLTGQAFGINEYSGVSNIEVSKAGAASWTSVAAITVWGDEAVSGALAVGLGVGKFDVRVTSSDGEQDTYENAFSFPAGGGMFVPNTNSFLCEYGVI